jgi:hypothetical protein
MGMVQDQGTGSSKQGRWHTGGAKLMEKERGKRAKGTLIRGGGSHTTKERGT